MTANDILSLNDPEHPANIALQHEHRLEEVERRFLDLNNLDEITPRLGSVDAIELSVDSIRTSADVVDINWWLPIGLSDDVVTRINAIAYDGVEYVYVGGGFTRIGGVAANNIARYSLVTRNWAQFNGGVNGTVQAIAITNAGLILIGGGFTDAGGVANADGIAISSGATWAALGTGVSAGTIVYALAVDSANNYYAAGSFTLMGGVANTSGVAKWTGAVWTAMGTGASAGGRALAIDSANNVFLGTTTLNIGGVAVCDYIGKWNGSAWSGLGAGADGAVYALAVDSNDVLYVGGAFTVVDPGFSGLSAPRIAMWNGTWVALGTGADATVYALAVDLNDYLIAGGAFGSMDAVDGTSRIAIWNGDFWDALSNGGGVTAVGGKEVNALLALPSNSVMAGGFFDYVGAIISQGIAQWCKPLNEAIDIVASLLEIYAERNTITHINGVFTNLSISTGAISSGTYTPTLFNTTNVAASTSYQAQYMRVGNVVTVSGRVDVDPTAAGAVLLGMSLPVASNFGAVSDCAGVAYSPVVAAQGAAVDADTTNDRAQMRWIAVDVTNRAMMFTFTYEVI